MIIETTLTFKENVQTIVYPFTKNQWKENFRLLESEYSLDAANLELDQNGTTLVVESHSNRKFIFFGIDDGASPARIRTEATNVIRKNAGSIAFPILLDLRPIEAPEIAFEIISGLCLSDYHLGRYKSEDIPTERRLKQAKTIIRTDESRIDRVKIMIHEGQVLASAQKNTMDLVNGPGNMVHSYTLVKYAKNLDSSFKSVSVKIFDRKKIKRLGMGGLLAVNQGSQQPPVFILLQYKPSNSKKNKTRKLGLVGKGITFDTGGLSIKPSANMHYMKSDLGGGAAVLGIVEAAASMQIPVSIVAGIPVTDNCVDAGSFKPGDIIKSYIGKTIEVINTDAEGRLILADALSFISKEHSPDILIDLATLTGSCVRTFGYHCACLFSNNDVLADQLMKTGLESGEKVWPLPMWTEYEEMLRSDIADVKNLPVKPVAGAISAAKFLQLFILNHPSWAHLDIAGVALKENSFGYDKVATAFGVRLIIDFMRKHMIV
jgi:leucyl aminopeptidase